MKVKTIGELIEDGWRVMGHCAADNCSHVGRVDLGRLARRYGRDARIDTVKLRCSMCESRKVILSQHQMPATPALH